MSLLRLSALDVSARILLGRRKELEAVAAAENSTNKASADEAQDYYFDYDGELVMMGTDYFSAGVAPDNDGMLDHMENVAELFLAMKKFRQLGTNEENADMNLSLIHI